MLSLLLYWVYCPQLLHAYDKGIVQDLVNIHLVNSFFPKTLRVMAYPPHDYNYPSLISLLDESQVPMIIGSVRPLTKSPDPRSISTGRMVGWIEVFRYVTVVYVSDRPGAINQCIKDLQTIVNRRWERLLIIAESNAGLKSLLGCVTVKEWLHKFSLSLESPLSFYADPIVYDEGKMIELRNIEDIPVKKEVGGNLWGRHFRIAGSELSPWMSKSGTDESGDPIYEGQHINMIRYSAIKFNYTFEFSYDLSYGIYTPENDSWSGMYARVFYPEEGYHFTIFHGYEYDWSYGVDQPSCLSYLDFMFVTGHPITELKWYAFLLPLSLPVWIWIVVIFIFVGVVQFFVMYLYHNRKMKYVVYDSATFLPIAMALEQGLCDIPKGARYISLVLLLGCTVLSTGYKATLRNNVAFPKPEAVPTDFEELGDREDYTVYLFTSGQIEQSLVYGSNMPALQKIRGRMILEYDLGNCVKNTFLKRKHACMSWFPLLPLVTAQTLTVITTVDPIYFSRGRLKPTFMSMSFQKDSVFVDSFNGIAQWVWESGVMLKWQEGETNKAKKKGAEMNLKEKDRNPEYYNLLMDQAIVDDGDRKPLAMSNVWAIFAILPLGFVICLFLFGAENYVFYKHEVDTYLFIRRKRLGQKLNKIITQTRRKFRQMRLFYY